MMSHRAKSASIMQLTFPDCETKPASGFTSRSPVVGPVTLSGHAAGSDAVACAVIDVVLPESVAVARHRRRQVHERP
jgi:hypothetical protein